MQENSLVYVITDWIEDTEEKKKTVTETMTDTDTATFIGIIVPVQGDYLRYNVSDNGESLKHFLNEAAPNHIIDAIAYCNNRKELIGHLITQGQSLYYCKRFRLHIIHSVLPISEMDQEMNDKSLHTMKNILNDILKTLVAKNDNFMQNVSHTERDELHFKQTLFEIPNTNKKKKSLVKNHKTLGKPCEKQNLYTK
ncbi:MAG: hypothetical protein LEGION0398_MBIBDBAK_00831 [Legionellaceae bacterium]